MGGFALMPHINWYSGLPKKVDSWITEHFHKGAGGELKYQKNIVNHAIAAVTALDMH
jgi:hypothetical protein